MYFKSHIFFLSEIFLPQLERLELRGQRSYIIFIQSIYIYLLKLVSLVTMSLFIYFMTVLCNLSKIK